MRNTDFSERLDQARRKLPLQTMMQQRGHTPANQNWKTFPHCPFCSHKGSAGVKEFEGRQYFKCFNSKCPTGTAADKGAWDEIEYLAYVLNANRREASVLYLKEAGLWDEHLAKRKPPQTARQRPAENNLPSAPSPSSPQSSATEELESANPSVQSTNSLGKTSAGSNTAPAHDATASLEEGHPSRPVSPPDDEIINSDVITGYPPSDAALPVPTGDAAAESGTPAGEAASAPSAAAGEPPEPPVTGDGSGGDGGEVPTEPEGGSPVVKALRWFYARLVLLNEDREMLWKKRGLTAQTCEALGFKSNREANKAILLEMLRLFPVAVLIEAGLFSLGKAGQPPKPNSQFCGYGLISRGRRDENGKKGEDTWGFCHPILIPYFNSDGEVVHIRPHKGGIADKAPRLYVTRVQKSCRSRILGLHQPESDYAIITEGEFKAAALWQALGGKIAVASLPGITMSKPLFGDIEDFLDASKARRVIVSFDNEEKGDPKLPGYVRDPRDRYDAQIWARKLAKAVTKEGYDGRVCLLPDEWRNEFGKVDFDSALAMLIRERADMGGLLPQEGAAGEPLSNMVWQSGAAWVGEQFLRVLNTATPVHEQYQFFTSEAERIIQNALIKLEYERRLPRGDEKTVALVRRLQRVARKVKEDPRRLSPSEELSRTLMGFLFFLARKYQDVSGGYFVCKRLAPNNEKEWQAALGWAHDKEDVEITRACEVALEGIPEVASDFVMDAKYELIRSNGKRDRLVVLKSKHGRQSKLISLPSAPFSQPSKWREWLLDQGGYSWLTGERPLNDLQADIARDTAYLEVTEVTVRGWHEESKLMIYEDVSFTPDGQELKPDKNGIVWYNGAGYKISDKDMEGEQFTQSGAKKPYGPRMHPDRQMKLAPGQTETDAVRSKCGLVFKNLYETLGGYDGFMVFGMMLAYGAGPELYSECGNQFPGLWLHGETGQGKTSLARWMMRMWGFNLESGIIIKGSSAPGLSIALQQYGDLPVWVDEVQIDCPEPLMEKLKNVFDRASGVKKNFNTDRRKILSGALVTGVARSTDAQVLARYAHVQVASQNRLASHFHSFQEESPDFFFIGRHILRHRRDFVQLTLTAMREWMKSDAMKNIEPRSRITHGVAYAAVYGLVGLLQLDLPQILVAKDGGTRPAKLGEFKAHLLVHCREAVTELREKVNVNQFWHDLMSALESHAFGHTSSDRRRLFRVEEDKSGPFADIPGYQLKMGEEHKEKRWVSKLLYLQLEPVLNMMRAWKRSMGINVQIDINDLRAQMKTRPYWDAGRNGQGHRMRFEGITGQKRCICIRLDFHELGYQPADETAWQEALHPTGDALVCVERSDWEDPRLGELFVVEDALRVKKEGTQ